MDVGAQVQEELLVQIPPDPPGGQACRLGAGGRGLADAVREVAATVNGLGHVLTGGGHVQPEAVQQSRDAYARAEPRPTFRIRVGADVDKYAADTPMVAIDCESRRPLCKSACCRLAYVLGTQDLDEGVIRWQYGDPYIIAKRDSGWCVHLATDGSCADHGCRPLACRQYDCRHNAEIWIDFDRRIPNPALGELPAID